MNKRLIVNSQIEFLVKLHDGKSMFAYVPWKLEICIVSILAWTKV